MFVTRIAAELSETSSSMSRRAEPSSRSLSPDRVVEVAVDILDEFGIEGLSIRTIAKRLNRSTMAMYRHVSSKDEVIRLAAEFVQKRDWRDTRSSTWESEVENFLRSSAELLGRHPWLLDFQVSHDPTATSVERMERLLNALEAAGFERDRHSALRLIWSTAVGLAAMARRLNREERSQEIEDLLTLGVRVMLEGLQAAAPR
jgi:AcrR family transcriptional regulator